MIGVHFIVCMAVGFLMGWLWAAVTDNPWIGIPAAIASTLIINVGITALFILGGLL